MEHAASLGEAAGDGQFPEPLRAYIEKVVRHAYKVVDADFDRLRAAGYSDAAIFDLTTAASVGAALGRLVRGWQALEEA
jgi:alkylhydroperoxidase family enzyme